MNVMSNLSLIVVSDLFTKQKAWICASSNLAILRGLSRGLASLLQTWSSDGKGTV